MRIRALSVFEGVIYHCYALDTAHPCRPILEVDARTQPDDLESGPLLMTWADYVRMAGFEAARACRDTLDQRGRIVVHQGVAHVAFPTWTHVVDDAP